MQLGRSGSGSPLEIAAAVANDLGEFTPPHGTGLSTAIGKTTAGALVHAKKKPRKNAGQTLLGPRYTRLRGLLKLQDHSFRTLWSASMPVCV